MVYYKCLKDAGTRRDEYLYNQVAFVEAWKNAILHNNYAEKQYPAIYLFDDHLAVFSNGNPLRNVSFDEFIIGKSRPINRQLTKIAMNIDITDQTGTQKVENKTTEDRIIEMIILNGQTSVPSK